MLGDELGDRALLAARPGDGHEFHDHLDGFVEIRLWVRHEWTVNRSVGKGVRHIFRRNRRVPIPAAIGRKMSQTPGGLQSIAGHDRICFATAQAGRANPRAVDTPSDA